MSHVCGPYTSSKKSGCASRLADAQKTCVAYTTPCSQSASTRANTEAAGQAVITILQFSCCIEFHVAGQRPTHPAFRGRSRPPHLALVAESQESLVRPRRLRTPSRLARRTRQTVPADCRLPRPQSSHGNRAFTSAPAVRFQSLSSPSLSRSSVQAELVRAALDSLTQD